MHLWNSFVHFYFMTILFCNHVDCPDNVQLFISDVRSKITGEKIPVRFTGTMSDAPPRVEVTYELPHLGAEEVIEEVITLLAKLENDRQETLVALQSERERSNTLRSKIDDLCRKRMTDLPMLVQQGEVFIHSLRLGKTLTKKKIKCCSIWDCFLLQFQFTVRSHFKCYLWYVRNQANT